MQENVKKSQETRRFTVDTLYAPAPRVRRSASPTMCRLLLWSSLIFAVVGTVGLLACYSPLCQDKLAIFRWPGLPGSWSLIAGALIFLCLHGHYSFLRTGRILWKKKSIRWRSL